jgi:hypothetical protein
MAYNHINYMRDIATRLKEIQHTENDVRFHRMSDIYQIEELLARLSVSQMPAIGVVEHSDGRITDNTADQVNDQQYYVATVFGRSTLFDHDAREQVKKDLKQIALKIMAKMKHDRNTDFNLETDHGLRHLDLKSISYRYLSALPDGIIALMISFVIEPTAQLAFNPDDWLPAATPDPDPEP